MATYFTSKSMGLALLTLAFAASLSGVTWKIYYTTPDSSGAYTCDFSGGVDICYIQRGPRAPILPTLLGLPVDAPVSFVMDTATLSTTLWPSNVHCAIADRSVPCGSANEYNTAGHKYLTTFWSDGTDLWSTPNTGNIQTVNAAHVNTSALQVFNLDTYGPGTFAMLFGSTAIATGCTDINSPAKCGHDISGAVAIPVGASSITVDDSTVTANSLFLLTFDPTLNTRLGIPTCSPVNSLLKVGSRVPGVSFQILIDTPPTIGPACVSFFLGN